MALQDNGSRDLREEPIGELLKRLSQETTTLVKRELDLAKAEMAEKGKQAGKGAGLLGGAGVAGLLMLASLSAAVIALLDTAMATWVAALIVTAIWGVIAAVLALQGKNRVQEATPAAPEQTIESVKEDVQWAKTR
ncbi:MAG TPA: phage holin family protein [Solirubrobacteraceae bacterium]|nr:phage holin family protein [Solirubrobacteraceae bacterium]